MEPRITVLTLGVSDLERSLAFYRDGLGLPEVDAVIEPARRAGATVGEPPQDRVWGGYSGYFQDPDGHLWEVVWNPQLIPA